jgi:hypothetical protein
MASKKGLSRGGNLNILRRRWRGIPSGGGKVTEAEPRVAAQAQRQRERDVRSRELNAQAKNRTE